MSKPNLRQLARFLVTVATIGFFVGGASATASADTGDVGPGAGRFDTAIAEWLPDVSPGGLWTVLTSGGTPDSRVFTVPGPGLTGPIGFAADDGTMLCLDVAQVNPFVSLLWTPESRATCQDVTTVVDPATGKAGFRATGGPYDGRYLGDESRGGRVDWAQASFFGVDVPALPITPPIPTLQAPAECGVEPSVLLPSLAGVLYQQTRTGSTVHVTATVADGYLFAGGATTDWTFDVAPSPCLPPADGGQATDDARTAGDAEALTTAQLAATGAQPAMGVLAVGTVLVLGGVAVRALRSSLRRAR
ncbi:hypothetical protein ACI2IX_18885 [Leifsonia aquatica]|uniref:hypothetical protein n=1 Tax=Leifsonia aquatica TaxID=144185 RepID=UPI00384B4D99